jgi:hypothetical protein
MSNQDFTFDKWIKNNRKIDFKPSFTFNDLLPQQSNNKKSTENILKQKAPTGITVKEIFEKPVLLYYIIGIVIGFIAALVHTNMILEVIIIIVAFIIFYMNWKGGKDGKNERYATDRSS